MAQQQRQPRRRPQGEIEVLRESNQDLRRENTRLYQQLFFQNEEIRFLRAVIQQQNGLPQSVHPEALMRSLFPLALGTVADLDNQHGKPVPKEKVHAIQALLKSAKRANWATPSPIADAPPVDLGIGRIAMSAPPQYKMGDKMATRQTYDNALLPQAEANKRVIALDGYTSSSSFSNAVQKPPNQLVVQCYIAEQNVVGAVRGKPYSRKRTGKPLRRRNYQVQEIERLKKIIHLQQAHVQTLREQLQFMNQQLERSDQQVTAQQQLINRLITLIERQNGIQPQQNFTGIQPQL